MSLLEALAWDSEFFGFAIARVARGIRPGQLGEVAREADAQGVVCTYLLAPASDAALLDRAQAHGFVVRDVRLELRRTVVGHPASMDGLRVGAIEDLPLLEPIARERFSTTRFFADERFPSERSAQMYVEWLRKGLLGEGGRTCLVTDLPCGFVVCELDRDTGSGRVALIAVSAEASGRGLGASLMAGVGAQFAGASLASATVVTQASNIAAQRLYQASGYRATEAALWLHRWRP